MKYVGLYDNNKDIVTKEKLDAVEAAIPTKTSQLDNDSGYITAVQAPVQSVNNKTGTVSLTAADVSAIPSTLTGTAGQVLTKTADGQEWKDAASPQPSTTTPLAPTETGSVGASTAYARGDHVHPKQAVTKSDVGLGNVDNVKQYSASNPPPYPVTSVNGQTGDVEVQSGSEAAAYTATLTTSGWAQSGSRYAQTVNVTGVTASTPVVLVDVALSGTDIDADAAALEAWGIVSANNVAQGDGMLTFYALSVPSVNIPVNVGVC